MPSSEELQDAHGPKVRVVATFEDRFSADMKPLMEAIDRLEAGLNDKRNSYQRVKEFHETFGHPIADSPTVPAQVTCDLRIDLIEEEFNELKLALEEGDIVGIADALADLEYVINGAALAFGIDLPAVVAEVHRSNMTKLGEDGKPIFREDGKVLKGPDYEPPNLNKALWGE